MPQHLLTRLRAEAMAALASGRYSPAAWAFLRQWGTR